MEDVADRKRPRVEASHDNLIVSSSFEIFEQLRVAIEESNAIKEDIRSAVEEINLTCHRMQYALLPVHGQDSDGQGLTAALHEAKKSIPELRQGYAKLSTIIYRRPEGEYYRFHDHFKFTTSTVCFLLAFVHWLETGALLTRAEVQSLLLDEASSKFHVDLEDYLIGVCSLSNELPRYVINRATAGDYACAERVSSFLNELFAGFRQLNLRNDVLRRKFDGIKYDLKKVEEVLYDIRIRGLDPKKDQQEQK
eukprot:jgi/Mesvir1/6125/Mv00829-RA.1